MEDVSRMNDQPQQDSEFQPKGAIAFFTLLIIFFGIVWGAFYALMLYRR
jgi:hypothetical protein